MRIRQRTNNKTNSFKFSYDLSKGDYLKKILELFQINEVYICIYGLADKTIFDNKRKKIQIKKLALLHSFKSLQEFVLYININELTNLFSIINNSFDELVVWCPCTNWEDFIKSLNEPKPFLTFRKNKIEDKTDFYLSYGLSDFNVVEIISNLSFHNTKNIKKEDLIKILK